MKSCEPNVSPSSDYYMYSPSLGAMEMFFYPLCIGHFVYEPGYTLRRSSYDSFLLMYLENGCMTLEAENRTAGVSAGEFVLLDCYRPHAYSSPQGCESVWCHFDGPVARAFFRNITSRLGCVFSMADPSPAVEILLSLLESFRQGKPVQEALVSRQISDLLTGFLLSSPQPLFVSREPSAVEKAAARINEQFDQNLTVEDLAREAGLSQYHFIRSFKKETGFTPHEYLVHTRLNTARYLLKNSRLSVKDICFRTGFSSESVFCGAFRRHTGLTPSQYRNQPGIPD